MTPEQMAALTPAEMESTCICGHQVGGHIEDSGECIRCTSADITPCESFRSVWNAGEAQYEQRYSRP